MFATTEEGRLSRANATRSSRPGRLTLSERQPSTELLGYFHRVLRDSHTGHLILTPRYTEYRSP
jgi:hypothetical protein